MKLEGTGSYHSIMTASVLYWLVFQHLFYLSFANQCFREERVLRIDRPAESREQEYDT